MQLTYGRIDLCTYQRREKHPMYTLITAKSLWTIICIGEITVLFVWLLEYGKDLLHVQYGRLFHFSIVIYIHLNSPDENWKKVFLSMVCPLKMHRVSPVFVPLYTTCSIHGVFGHEKSIGASPTFKKNFPDPLVVKTCNIFLKTRYMFSPLGGQENFFERGTCANRFLVPKNL